MTDKLDEPGDWSEAAAFAASNPPSVLDNFKARLRPAEELDTVLVQFDLACRNCEGEAFHVGGYPKSMAEENDYGLAPGSVLLLPPHRLVCVSCRSSVPIFDPRRDGYDGALGNEYFGEVGDGGDEVSAGQFKVSVSYFYNVELDELNEIASEDGLRPADLYDAFGLSAEPIDDGEPIELDYECA
ncbi:hypothetical protein C3941_15570 [Kaistia algarum]|uniref:hypothetical protein n=1 Tax=Kaistia algarum TaxID=2083279 RepID=UPI000CE7EAA9|nr:hypothetical protein [Kaistia algarum]MCX5514493.1 hypothetical protein [Kaistia algarum]PPE79220.1 hypothetical protein C3941_15570 [Kaistia algarum]